MKTLRQLLERNHAWANRTAAASPGFFETLSRQQAPQYLWIGCSDSRVPANQIVDLAPGELFVHRNVANLVVHTDLNCLSVLQYAIDVLRVRHVIVCGHYGCGGVQAAFTRQRLGLIDNWLRHVQDVETRHQAALARIADPGKRCDRLCELNVIEGVANLCQTTIAQDAWARGQPLSIHGWIYRLSDGLLHDLGICISEYRELAPAHAEAVGS
jgi:carbonic anhydrase